MPGTFTCRHCGKTLPRNPRLKKNKKQLYCNAPECKQAKKSARKKERYHADLYDKIKPAENHPFHGPEQLFDLLVSENADSGARLSHKQ